MSDTSNLYNDMRNLIHFLPFICSGYPWRAIGNTLTVLQHRKYPIIHSLRSENVATDSKNKETLASLFFSRRQRSKVIFRVTQNSTTVSFALPRNYLALRGCRPSHPRPMVAGREVGYKPTLHLPMVTSVSPCASVSDYHTRISITSESKGYGK